MNDGPSSRPPVVVDSGPRTHDAVDDTGVRDDTKKSRDNTVLIVLGGGSCCLLIIITAIATTVMYLLRYRPPPGTYNSEISPRSGKLYIYISIYHNMY